MKYVFSIASVTFEGQTITVVQYYGSTTYWHLQYVPVVARSCVYRSIDTHADGTTTHAYARTREGLARSKAKVKTNGETKTKSCHTVLLLSQSFVSTFKFQYKIIIIIIFYTDDKDLLDKMPMSPLQRQSSNVFVLVRFCCAALTIGWMKSAAAFTSVSSLTSFGHWQQQRVQVDSIPTLKRNNKNNFNIVVQHSSRNRAPTKLFVIADDLALVIGQETYGFGIVILAEAIYSFLQAPSLEEVKVLIPGIIGAVRSNVEIKQFISHTENSIYSRSP